MQSLLHDARPRGCPAPVPDLSQSRCTLRGDARDLPGLLSPVVRQAEDGEHELSLLSWGFLLLQPERAPRRVTNVRDDKVLTSSFWRPSFEDRRCLVPASSYCEPKGEKPATWHWFARIGAEPRPLFSFAGVWRRYKGSL